MFQLVDVRERRGLGGYGALAAQTHPALGVCVDASVVLSQLGYCTAFVLFVVQVLTALWPIPAGLALWAQALLANGLIAAGLLTVACVAAARLEQHGPAH